MRVLDSTEIMTDSIESGGQHAYGSGNAGYQHRIAAQVAQRLVQICLEKGAEPAFWKHMILGKHVEFGDNICSRGAPQTVRSHLAFKDEIPWQKVSQANTTGSAFW
jgi:hypothetical protein